MCGLFGWNLDGAAVSRDVLSTLATGLVYLNDRRGGDAWGFWSPHDGTMSKHVGKMAENVTIADMTKYRTLCGHTRWATRGSKCEANAHPFRFGAITGCHNGAIWNADELDKKYHRSHAVDSMHIFDHLADGRSLDEMEGYGTIVYTSERARHAVYLCRFERGELAVVSLEVGGLVWSSSRLHLTEALSLAGLKIKSFYDTDEFQVYEASKGTLWTTSLRHHVRAINPTRKHKGYKVKGWIGGEWVDGDWDGGMTYGPYSRSSRTPWTGGRKHDDKPHNHNGNGLVVVGARTDDKTDDTKGNA